jgi:hypothetical protein
LEGGLDEFVVKVKQEVVGRGFSRTLLEHAVDDLRNVHR